MKFILCSHPSQAHNRIKNEVENCSWLKGKDFFAHVYFKILEKSRARLRNSLWILSNQKYFYKLFTIDLGYVTKFIIIYLRILHFFPRIMDGTTTPITLIWREKKKLE